MICSQSFYAKVSRNNSKLRAHNTFGISSAPVTAHFFSMRSLVLCTSLCWSCDSTEVGGRNGKHRTGGIRKKLINFHYWLVKRHTGPEEPLLMCSDQTTHLKRQQQRTWGCFSHFRLHSHTLERPKGR